VSRWRRTPLQLTALLAGGAIGAALLSGRNTPFPAESSPDVRFARDMSAHHAQAVEMSVTMLKRASDPAVKLLAQDIALTQQGQIGQMSGWLMAWNRPIAGSEPPMSGMNREAMGMALSEEVKALDHLPPTVAEGRYLALLRKHHLGGVLMAKSALNTVREPQVKAFAQRVIASQTSEIRAIDALLKTRSIQPPAAAADNTDLDNMDGMNHE
jgi:uncharacterized protein (DUF305 family)